MCLYLLIILNVVISVITVQPSWTSKERWPLKLISVDQRLRWNLHSTRSTRVIFYCCWYLYFLLVYPLAATPLVSYFSFYSSDFLYCSFPDLYSFAADILTVEFLKLFNKNLFHIYNLHIVIYSLISNNAYFYLQNATLKMKTWRSR